MYLSTVPVSTNKELLKIPAGATITVILVYTCETRDSPLSFIHYRFHQVDFSWTFSDGSTSNGSIKPLTATGCADPAAHTGTSGTDYSALTEFSGFYVSEYPSSPVTADTKKIRSICKAWKDISCTTPLATSTYTLAF